MVLDPSLNPTLLSQAVPKPAGAHQFQPALDYALSKNNTLTVHYQYYRDSENNAGVGQFSLPSQGYNLLSTEQMLQASDTQVIGSKIINETRFQYLRDADHENPLDTTPTINVLQAFDGGGSYGGKAIDLTNHYEVQNATLHLCMPRT